MNAKKIEELRKAYMETGNARFKQKADSLERDERRRVKAEIAAIFNAGNPVNVSR